MSIIVSAPRSSHEDSQAIGGGDTVPRTSTTTSSSAISDALDFADMKREAVRKSLEEVHSQFSSIGLLTRQWKEVEDHLESIKKSIARQWKESVINLKRAEWRTKRLNNKEKDLTEKSKEIDATYVLVSRCYSTVLEKEMECSRSLQEAESVRQGLELILNQKLSETEEFRLKKQSFDDREAELREREKRLNLIEREMSEKSLYFESQRKKFKDRHIKLKKWEDELRRRWALLKMREDKLGTRERALSEEMQNLGIKQKKVEQEYKAFKEKERCVDSMLVQVKEDPIDPSYADIRFYISMNGRELLRYLSRHVADFEMESMHDEVRRAFLLSANPAKLVLDAIHAFYPSMDSAVSNHGLNLETVRRTCIFILERFKEMDLKNIPDEEMERAKLLAIDWKSKMKISDCYGRGCLEIAGFRQLVASYRLHQEFGDVELLKSVEMGFLCKRLDNRDKCEDRDVASRNVVEPDNRSAVEEISDDILYNDPPPPKFNMIVLGLKAAQACGSIRPSHSVPKRILKREKGHQKRKSDHGEEINGSNLKKPGHWHPKAS